MLRQLNSLVIQNVGVSGFFFTLAAARITAAADHGVREPDTRQRICPARSRPRRCRPKHDLGTLRCRGRRRNAYTEIEPGDRIVLYTDGSHDVFDSRGEMLKVEGLQNFIREAALLPFDEMSEAFSIVSLLA